MKNCFSTMKMRWKIEYVVYRWHSIFQGKTSWIFKVMEKIRFLFWIYVDVLIFRVELVDSVSEGDKLFVDDEITLNDRCELCIVDLSFFKEEIVELLKLWRKVDCVLYSYWCRMVRVESELDFEIFVWEISCFVFVLSQLL